MFRPFVTETDPGVHQPVLSEAIKTLRRLVILCFSVILTEFDPTSLLFRPVKSPVHPYNWTEEQSGKFKIRN